MWIALLLLACPKNEPSDRCLDRLVSASAQTIDRYTWNGADYFHVDHGCCDQYLEVYKADTCELVCAPSGGIDGRGDGRCPSFYDEAVDQGTVYPAP